MKTFPFPQTFFRVMLLLLIVLKPITTTHAQTVPQIPTVLAQSKTNSATAPEPASTEFSLPHGKFVWDYLLVFGLVSATLYAVCRSSRRI